MMTLPDVIPLPWKIGAAAALLVAAAGAVLAYGAHKYDQGHEAAISQRAAQDAVAIINRTSENATMAAAQSARNFKITETKNAELAPVIRTIYVDRVRVGTASCGPTPSPETEGTGGGNGTDPAGRLVREDVERDTRALDQRVEEAFATGRACQRFLEENGLVP